MADEIKTLIEESKQAVHDLQKRMDALQADGKTNSDGMVELKGKFEDALVKLEEQNAAMAAEKKAREELELVLARGGNEKGGQISGDAGYRKSFESYVRTKKAPDEEAQTREVELLAKQLGVYSDRGVAEMKAMLVGSNPDGGYLVPVDLRNEIKKRVYELSPMRQVANVVTTSREKLSYPVDDDLTINAGWLGEIGSRVETDTPQLRMVDIPTHELYAEPAVTNWMLEDAVVNVEQWLRGKVADYFARLESTAFVTGNGSNKPRGFLDYPTTGVETYQFGSIGTKDTGTNDKYDADDIIKLQYNLIERYQANATWMCNRQTFSGIATLKNSDGDYLINPRILFEGAKMQLLGRPVVFSPDMAAEDDPSDATDGAKILAYGDFREGYTIADRLGITILRDPFTSKGFVKYSTRQRVGGGVTNFQAIKVLAIQ